MAILQTGSGIVEWSELKNGSEVNSDFGFRFEYVINTNTNNRYSVLSGSIYLIVNTENAIYMKGVLAITCYVRQSSNGNIAARYSSDSNFYNVSWPSSPVAKGEYKVADFSMGDYEYNRFGNLEFHASDGTPASGPQINPQLEIRVAYPPGTETYKEYEAYTQIYNIVSPAIVPSSTIAASSGYLGQTITITINNNQEGITNTLTYTFGNLTGVIATKTSETMVVWTIPDDFVGEFTETQTQKSGTITCETYKGDTSYNSATCPFTVYVNTSPGEQPILNPEIYDTNAATLAVTGNKNVLVQYKSTAYFNTNALPVGSATIKTQQVKNGTMIKNAPNGTGTFENVLSPTFDILVVDNRGARASAFITKQWVPYIKLTATQKVTLDLSDEVSATATVAISGNYYKGSFGAVNNTLKIEIRHTQNDGTMGSWIDLTSFIDPTYDTTAGTYYIDFNISGMSYDQTYTFESRATDRLETVTTSGYATKVMPVFDWSKDDFKINVPTQINGGNAYGAITLFDGNSNDVITLPNPISSYAYIDIYYTDNNDRGGNLARIYGNTTVDLGIIEASSSTSTYLRRTAYICSNTTLSPVTVSAGYVLLTHSGVATPHTTGTNYIYIKKVIGYK